MGTTPRPAPAAPLLQEVDRVRPDVRVFRVQRDAPEYGLQAADRLHNVDGSWILTRHPIPAVVALAERAAAPRPVLTVARGGAG